MAQVTLPPPQAAIYPHICTYPFASDASFQSGLSAILPPGTSEEEKGRITLRAQCFYFSRKFHIPIDPAAYAQWLLSQPAHSHPAAPSGDPHSQTSTFSDTFDTKLRPMAAIGTATTIAPISTAPATHPHTNPIPSAPSAAASSSIQHPLTFSTVSFPAAPFPETLPEPQPQESQQPSQPPQEPAPYPPTFSQIVELITTGQTIPGIRHVPDTLLSGLESPAVRAARRKPWEEKVGKRGVEGDGGGVGGGVRDEKGGDGGDRQVVGEVTGEVGSVGNEIRVA